MSFKVLGICGGNGVVLHPFRENLVGNIETRGIFRTPDDIQWRLNFPKVPLDKARNTRYSPNLVDVIVGAPDCGHSSMLAFSRAKKMGNPKENESLQTYLYSLRLYRPKFFMMENLPKLLDNWGEEPMFEGYRIKYWVAPVSHWGNSQVSRVRLVVVGVREDIKSVKWSDFRLEKPSYLPRVGELLEGLNYPNYELCHVRESSDTYLSLYHGDKRKITVQEAQDIWNTEFVDSKKWVVNKGNLKNQPGIYRNFEDDYPLTVRKQNRQFNPDGSVISPREIARIQNIPDSFKLWYTQKSHQYCLNKARVTTAKTPPYDIGKWFANILKQL